MYDMDRNIRPLGEAYQKLIREWSHEPVLNWTNADLIPGKRETVLQLV
jgi:hypothetical protein